MNGVLVRSQIKSNFLLCESYVVIVNPHARAKNQKKFIFYTIYLRVNRYMVRFNRYDTVPRLKVMTVKDFIKIHMPNKMYAPDSCRLLRIVDVPKQIDMFCNIPYSIFFSEPF